MTEIRYLMDENVNPLLRRELLRREPHLVVWQVVLRFPPERFRRRCGSEQ